MLPTLYCTVLYCTVHTLREQAHHTGPPLCDCDAESKATPTCDKTQHNTTTHTSSRAHSTPNWIGSLTDLRITQTASRTLDSRVRENNRCSYYWTSALPADGIRRKIAKHRMSARQESISTVER